MAAGFFWRKEKVEKKDTREEEDLEELRKSFSILSAVAQRRKRQTLHIARQPTVSHSLLIDAYLLCWDARSRTKVKGRGSLTKLPPFLFAGLQRMRSCLLDRWAMRETSSSSLSASGTTHYAILLLLGGNVLLLVSGFIFLLDFLLSHHLFSNSFQRRCIRISNDPSPPHNISPTA